jgi:hypothetical protein
MMISMTGRKIRLRLQRRSRLIAAVRLASVARDTSYICAVLEGKISHDAPALD